jgi:hypothetical protein
MTREQATKAKEITQDIENVEKILNFLSGNDRIIFVNESHTLFPSNYPIYSEKLNTRLKTAIIDTLNTLSKELEDELAAL